MFTFDWTVSLGNIFTVAGVIGMWAWMFMAMNAKLIIQSSDLVRLRERLDLLNEAFSQIGKVLTQVAVQDNRLTMIEKAIDELRHGHGYIRAIKTNG